MEVLQPHDPSHKPRHAGIVVSDLTRGCPRFRPSPGVWRLSVARSLPHSGHLGHPMLTEGIVDLRHARIRQVEVRCARQNGPKDNEARASGCWGKAKSGARSGRPCSCMPAAKQQTALISRRRRRRHHHTTSSSPSILPNTLVVHNSVHSRTSQDILGCTWGLRQPLIKRNTDSGLGLVYVRHPNGNDFTHTPRHRQY